MTLPSTSLKTLLARQYGGTNVQTLIDGLNDLIEEKLDNPTIELQNEGGINARGVFLDYLGARFDLPRPFKSAATALHFGFDGDPLATPFNQAPFVDPEALGETVPISDKLYRSVILATAAMLVTTATQDNINRILNTAYPGSFVVDNLDMTMTLYFRRDLLSDDQAIILQELVGVPKPAGVRYDIVEYSVFGFDGNGVGFDQGPFAE